MKILMVSPQFKPIVGGYERAAERLSKGLASRGHQVVVLAERRFPDWPYRERDHGVDLHRWWCVYKRRLHTFTSLIGLLLYLLRFGQRFDVWHIHHYGVHAALSIAIGRLMQRPTVLKLTSSSYGGISEALRVGRLSKIMTSLHRQASAVAAPSRETALEARTFGYPAERVYLLQNGVDTNRFKPTSDVQRRWLRAKLQIEDMPTVIAVGRLVADKNIDGVLAAWAKASTRFSGEWRLVVVGDGPARPALTKQLTRLGVQDQVRLVGHQSNIEDWMGCADLFVQASHREGLSNTMLEAMAAGLPVVITAVSGAQECVGETGAGIVVPIGDPDALEGALVALASDPSARDRCGAAARGVVETGFSIERAVDRCEALYRGLVHDSRSPKVPSTGETHQ